MVVWYHLLFIFIYHGFAVKTKGEKQLQRIEKSGIWKRVAYINVTSRDCQRRTMRYLSFWGHVAPESNKREKSEVRESVFSLLVIFFIYKRQSFFWVSDWREWEFERFTFILFCFVSFSDLSLFSFWESDSTKVGYSYY